MRARGDGDKFSRKIERRHQFHANLAAIITGFVSQMPKPFTKKEIETFFARLKARDPDPKTELVYRNPYTLLVAVVLSAQATDKGVNKATTELFKIAATPQKMVALGEAGLTQHIKTIGLYRNKAKNVIALSKLLIEQHGGNIPHDRDALEALPGVGRKTANVILNVAFGEPTIAVDTHIFRVANRTGIAPGKNPREVEDGLERVVPSEYKLHAHHWLILHGRYTCIARKPLCPVCVVRDLCRYPDKTKEGGTPTPLKTKRKAIKIRERPAGRRAAR
jgi:endonuclease III